MGGWVNKYLPVSVGVRAGIGMTMGGERHIFVGEGKVGGTGDGPVDVRLGEVLVEDSVELLHHGLKEGVALYGWVGGWVVI